MAKKTCKQLAVLLAATIMVIPIKSVSEYVSRATIDSSIAVWAPYVALYKINNYFLQNFGGLFQDPAAIRENTVFRINKETGLLEFYGEVG